MEWVYVIGSGSEGPVKIGRARDVRQRRHTLQTGSLEPLRVLAKIPGDARTERAIHKALRPWRVDREWFSCRDMVIDLFFCVRERMLDRAQEAMGDDWTPDEPGLDELYEADRASPEDIAAEFRETKAFFEEFPPHGNCS